MALVDLVTRSYQINESLDKVSLCRASHTNRRWPSRSTNRKEMLADSKHFPDLINSKLKEIQLRSRRHPEPFLVILPQPCVWMVRAFSLLTGNPFELCLLDGNSTCYISNAAPLHHTPLRPRDILCIYLYCLSPLPSTTLAISTRGSYC
jgi:hypothetical protein